MVKDALIVNFQFAVLSFRNLEMLEIFNVNIYFRQLLLVFPDFLKDEHHHPSTSIILLIQLLLLKYALIFFKGKRGLDLTRSPI